MSPPRMPGEDVVDVARERAFRAIEAREGGSEPLAHAAERRPRVVLVAVAARLDRVVPLIPALEPGERPRGPVAAAARDVLAAAREELAAQIVEAVDAVDRRVERLDSGPEHLRNDG